MINKLLRTISFSLLLLLGVLVLSPLMLKSQHITWYNNAQQRIDTLRRGTFGLNVFDKQGQPYTGPISVRMAKHEFPFGIAFDFYEGNSSMGNAYSTTEPVTASYDREVYRTKRWGNFLAYVLPAEAGKEYQLTMRFAELIFVSASTRLFNVYVEGQLFLEKFNPLAAAGGKNIAIDKTLNFVATRNEVSIEIRSISGFVSICGMVLKKVDGEGALNINCGGPALTTSNGNAYITETGFFDPESNPVASQEQWRKAAMYKYFNAGVSGNSFKWSGIQPQHTTPNYTNFDNAVRWTQKVGWDLRAHTLLWGGNDDHSMPRWVRNLPTPQAITDTCKMRVIREVTRYRGIIKDYDVMNEPLTGHADWLRKTVGDSIIWNSFKWARSADPDAELYVNDYNVEYNWGQAREYRDLIKTMLANGAPVTGVGMQAHFWDCCRPNINELVSNINIVAEAGLPIKLTEYDYGGNLTQAQQAADYIMVLTIAFSHPSVVGMYHWGLDDAGAWRPNTGFFDINLRPKLAADTLLYFTKKKWATNFDTQIADGVVPNFKAYYGTYDIEVTFDDGIKVFTVPLLKAHKDSVFVLHEVDAVLKGPKLIQKELLAQDKIRLVFDKPINAGSLKRSDFRFFSRPAIGLLDVHVDPEDSATVILNLVNKIAYATYISVSYFPGLLKGVDGSKVGAFGPESVPNPLDTNVGNFMAKENLFQVYPNPASSQITIFHPSSQFRVEIYNIRGQQVHAELSLSENIDIDVSGYHPGFYMLRLTDASNQTFEHKIVVQ